MGVDSVWRAQLLPPSFFCPTPSNKRHGLFLSQSSILVALGFLLPHLVLGYLLDFSIPEPFFSLLLLASISLLTHLYLKPILLDLLVASTTEKLKDGDHRRYASQVAANLQWVSFVLLWDFILATRWPRPSGTTEWTHAQRLESWTWGRGPLALVVWLGINMYESSDTEEQRKLRNADTDRRRMVRGTLENQSADLLVETGSETKKDI